MSFRLLFLTFLGLTFLLSSCSKEEKSIKSGEKPTAMLRSTYPHQDIDLSKFRLEIDQAGQSAEWAPVDSNGVIRLPSILNIGDKISIDLLPNEEDSLYQNFVLANQCKRQITVKKEMVFTVRHSSFSSDSSLNERIKSLGSMEITNTHRRDSMVSDVVSRWCIQFCTEGIQCGAKPTLDSLYLGIKLDCKKCSSFVKGTPGGKKVEVHNRVVVINKKPVSKYTDDKKSYTKTGTMVTPKRTVLEPQKPSVVVEAIMDSEAIDDVIDSEGITVLRNMEESSEKGHYSESINSFEKYYKKTGKAPLVMGQECRKAIERMQGLAIENGYGESDPSEKSYAIRSIRTNQKNLVAMYWFLQDELELVKDGKIPDLEPKTKEQIAEDFGLAMLFWGQYYPYYKKKSPIKGIIPSELKKAKPKARQRMKFLMDASRGAVVLCSRKNIPKAQSLYADGRARFSKSDDYYLEKLSELIKYQIKEFDEE